MCVCVCVYVCARERVWMCAYPIPCTGVRISACCTSMSPPPSLWNTNKFSFTEAAKATYDWNLLSYGSCHFNWQRLLENKSGVAILTITIRKCVSVCKTSRYITKSRKYAKFHTLHVYHTQQFTWIMLQSYKWKMFADAQGEQCAQHQNHSPD